MNCIVCDGPIVYGSTAGSGFNEKVWTHVHALDWTDSPHTATPKNA